MPSADKAYQGAAQNVRVPSKGCRLSLVGSAPGCADPVQVMNLHPTRGREADTTILLLGNSE